MSHDIYAGTTRRADTFDGITGEDGLYWISCQPLLLEAMEFIGLPGYRTCGEAPSRPGGQHTPDRMTSHYHGVPMAVASTWSQYHTEGREPRGFAAPIRPFSPARLADFRALITDERDAHRSSADEPEDSCPHAWRPETSCGSARALNWVLNLISEG